MKNQFKTRRTQSKSECIKMELASKEGVGSTWTIPENIKEGYYEVNLNGGYNTFFNSSMSEILDYTEEKMMSMNHRLYMDKEIVKKIFGEVKEVYRTGISSKTDHEQVKKNGSKMLVETSVTLMRDSFGEPTGFRGIVRDITKRKRTEEALRKSEERHRTILEDIDEGYYEIDLAGNFTFVNDAECRDMGYSREELIGMNYRLHTDEKTAKGLYTLYHNIYNTGKSVKGFAAQFISKDGRRHFNEVSASLIRDAEGNPIGFRGISKDITERKQAEQKLKGTLKNLRKSLGVTVHVLMSVIEARDPYTAGHQSRSADLARAIAKDMGLPREKIEGIRMAGSIHDIGKISIPTEILSKPAKLSDIEFFLIKEHPRKGYEILKHVKSPWPLAEIVYQHHERMDGSGYPRNLKGEEILMESRIMAVADVVEAMASHRPYRPSLGIDVALEEIKRNRGILYDEAVVGACLRLFWEKGFQLKDN